jgi:bifunctional enzyme CysN/CysC
LVDGLAAEREQGITIDVAYRYFSTETRKFIVADTPGHEQYTRNMVTGASTAELAVVLVDARKGVLTQTRRHSYIVSLLGIRKIVLAVNKLDLVDYSQDIYDDIVAQYRSFATEIGIHEVVPIPLSALRGDNVTQPSTNTPWYSGPTFMRHLETVEVDTYAASGPFRMPVQWVNRPDSEFRGFSGTIVSGKLHPGDSVRITPSGRRSTVTRIVSFDGDLDVALAGQAVTVTLSEEIDVSRGDILAAEDASPGVANQFEAHIIWMSEQEMLPGRRYLMKIGARTVGLTMAHPKYKINVNTLEHIAAKSLELNEIGVCNLNLDRPISFDPYVENRDTGGFVVIDRFTNGTVGSGLLHFALRRADNIHWQSIDVNKAAHAALKGHRPCVVWFTGLSGAGKSTIANLVERKLHRTGCHTYLLDGDNVRHGLNKDLGFTDSDRVENVRRVAEVAALMIDAGLIVLASFISPFRSERRLARDLVNEAEFCEVFVDVTLEVAERRDPKGLYRKARRGELVNLTGIDSPYEKPEFPEIHVDSTTMSADQAADAVIAQLIEMGVITSS